MRVQVDTFIFNGPHIRANGGEGSSGTAQFENNSEGRSPKRPEEFARAIWAAFKSSLENQAPTLNKL